MSGQSPYLFGVSEFTTQPLTFEEDVALYADLGVDTIEVCEAKLTPGDPSVQMALVTESGLAISSVQPATRTLFPSLSQPTPLDVSERMGRFKATIQRLAPYTPGVAYVTNTGIPPSGDMQSAIDTSIREYRAVAEFAAEQGVRVALEPLNASIVNIETAIWTVGQAMEIIAAVDHPSFGLCLDTWNVWQNADIEAVIRNCGDRIFVVQISDWRTPRSFQDRVIPGQGAIPLAALLAAIRATGYDGAYSVEIFSGEDLPDSLWKADPRTVIVESRAGLDAAWRAA